MKRGLIIASIFIIGLFMLSFVSAQISEEKSVFSIEDIYLGFEGSLTNQNGEKIDVLLGLVNLCWNAVDEQGERIKCTNLLYLNFNGTPLISYFHESMMEENMTRLTSDFIPLSDLYKETIADRISTISTDISFDENYAPMIDDIKIYKMERGFSSELEEFRLDSFKFPMGSPPRVYSLFEDSPNLFVCSKNTYGEEEVAYCKSICTDRITSLWKGANDRYDFESPMNVNEFCLFYSNVKVESKMINLNKLLEIF